MRIHESSRFAKWAKDPWSYFLLSHSAWIIVKYHIKFDTVGTRSENCRKFVPANRRPHNWKLYSSRCRRKVTVDVIGQICNIQFPRILWYECEIRWENCFAELTDNCSWVHYSVVLGPNMFYWNCWHLTQDGNSLTLHFEPFRISSQNPLQS